MRTLDDLDVEGKRVLVRVDFNVPLDEARNITDDARIRAALPTLKELRSKGASQLVLVRACSHAPTDGTIPQTADCDIEPKGHYSKTARFAGRGD